MSKASGEMKERRLFCVEILRSRSLTRKSSTLPFEKTIITKTIKKQVGISYFSFKNRKPDGTHEDRTQNSGGNNHMI